MKLIRYLIKAELLKSEDNKQPNGVVLKTFNTIGEYKVVKKNLNDQVNATIYGSNVDKMLSISTPLGNLEKFLMPKVSNKEDNISNYYIVIDNTKYKITSVQDKNIVIDRVQ